MPDHAPDTDKIDEFVRHAHLGIESMRGLVDADPTLLDRRSSWGERAIEAASHTGHQDIVSWLVDKGVEPDIFACVVLGRTGAVLAFLRSDPFMIDGFGVHQLPLLHFAVVGGHLDVLNLLLTRGCEVNRPGAESALHLAVRLGRKECITRLLAAGASPIFVNALGLSSIDLAATLDSSLFNLLTAHQAASIEWGA